MNVLFDVVVDFLARSAVWLAAIAALAAAAASLPWVAWGRGIIDWRSAALAGVIGALALASLAHRFGFPDPGSVAVWRRPVYPVWVAGGALLGALVLIAAVRRRPGEPAADQ